MQKTDALTFAEYQAAAAGFAVYPEWAKVAYPLLGLCGELAELIEKITAAVRPHYPCHSELFNTLMPLQRYGAEAGRLAKRLRDESGFADAGESVGMAKAVVEALKELRSNGTLAEIGDVLWMITGLCTDLDCSLENTAAANTQKLTDRRNRNTLRGSGDNR